MYYFCRMKCIERALSGKLLGMTMKFPVVFLAGPRQSGKSTLLKHALKNYEYINLEAQKVNDFALNDPRGFLNTFKGKVIIDDVHKAPGLISHIKNKIDEKGGPGMFVLSGRLDSQMKSSISELLSGLAVKLTLLPFSLSELAGAGKCPKSTNEWMFKGTYPELFLSTISPEIFFYRYTADLMELDIKSETKIYALNKFRRFLFILAVNSGSPMNLSKLGEELSIDARTANSWISALEECFILFRLAPYLCNSWKRPAKTPKIYFYDPGFLCSLLGLSSAEELNFNRMRNHIFETAVISEFVKKALNCGYLHKMYYARDLDNKEKEIDLIDASCNTALTLTEIRASQTVNEDYIKNLSSFNASEVIAENKTISKQVIYEGSETPVFEDVNYINWKSLG